MTSKTTADIHSPLMLRAHRLMDAFAKSDDERDFYLDSHEGFLVYVNLDASQEELDLLEAEVQGRPERFLPIPKLTFYETKKIMENFVHEKVYDIDTKEKLLDVIGSKEARERFLEFLHDQPNELDKWQQFYQERFRVRIIEWLRGFGIRFVFEEDIELPVAMIEKLKQNVFQAKVGKDLVQARKTLEAKAETYYSNEALNPRPKRGRPPKQQAKIEIEPQFAEDIYLMVPAAVRPFLFTPEITSLSSVTFSAKYDTQEEMLAKLKSTRQGPDSGLEELSAKLASLRNLSAQVAARRARENESATIEEEPAVKKRAAPRKKSDS
jgi:Uncharacterised protein family (UPF0158)